MPRAGGSPGALASRTPQAAGASASGSNRSARTTAIPAGTARPGVENIGTNENAASGDAGGITSQANSPRTGRPASSVNGWKRPSSSVTSTTNGRGGGKDDQ